MMLQAFYRRLLGLLVTHQAARVLWIACMGMCGAALAFGCKPAFAQSATPPSTAPLSGFAPPPEDPALGALGNLFGNVGGMNFMPGLPDGPIGQMFLVFNTAVISVAALFFLWNVLSATVQGAHDGEFLGRRYHSYWMPLRTFIGMSLLVPIFAGWSGAQVFMAWAMWAGTGIANAVHSTSRDIIAAETRQYAALPERPDFYRLTGDLYALTDELIRQLQQQRMDRSDGVDSSMASYVDLQFGLFEIYDPATRTLRVVAGADLPDGIMVDGYTNNNIGAVQITFAQPPAEYRQSYELQAAHELAVRRIVTDLVAAVRADAMYLGALRNEFPEFQAGLASFKAAEIPRAASATGRYIREMAQAQQAVAQFDAQPTRGQAFSTQYGWIGAGLGVVDGSSMSLESAGTATSSVYQRGDSPTADVALGRGGPGYNELYRTNLNKMLADVRASYSDASQQWSDGGLWNAAKAGGNVVAATAALLLTPAAAALPTAGGIEAKDTSEDVAKLVGPLNRRMRTVVNELAVAALGMMQVAANPLAAMQHMGISVLKVLQSTFNLLVFVGGVALGLALVSFGGAASIFVSLVIFLLPAIIALAIFGVKLAVILPFAPVILWLGAVLSYLVISIESMFGAPLWALVHLDPDGEGMGQRTTHGYIFLLNLLFRPAIMVICLALAYKLLSVLAGLGIAALSGPLLKVASAGGDSWIVPLGLLLGLIWVFISLMEVLIHASFAIVNIVPSQVMTWIGGTFGSHVGTDLDRNVHQGATAAAAAAGGVAGGMASTVAHRFRMHDRSRSDSDAADREEPASPEERGRDLGRRYRQFRGLDRPSPIATRQPPPPPPDSFTRSPKG